MEAGLSSQGALRIALHILHYRFRAERRGSRCSSHRRFGVRRLSTWPFARFICRVNSASFPIESHRLESHQLANLDVIKIAASSVIACVPVRFIVAGVTRKDRRQEPWMTIEGVVQEFSLKTRQLFLLRHSPVGPVSRSPVHPRQRADESRQARKPLLAAI